jgi:hypothetical protein
VSYGIDEIDRRGRPKDVRLLVTSVHFQLPATVCAIPAAPTRSHSFQALNMAKIKHARRIGDLPKPYHTAAMAEVDKQTDRGAAIVGAAYVDLVLREAITARLIDNTALMNTLFENRGPLQDFGARIQVAFALGVYGTRAYKDLCIIKDVRNAFAHSAEAMDFDHADVQRLCDGLWFPRKIRIETRPMPATAKERYIRGIELLTDGLYDDMRRMKSGQKISSFLMMGPNA